MAKLVSEQLPNDGGYHIPQLVEAANARLKQIGRQGKRATIAAKNGSLTIRFTYHDGKDNSQKNLGLGAIGASPKGILEAERIAGLVTGQLMAGRFDLTWFNQQIGKDTSEQTKQLTCKEMLEQYKKHYFKQRKHNKTPENGWYKMYSRLEKAAAVDNKPLSSSLIKQTIESTKSNSASRKEVLNGLTNLLGFFEIEGHKALIEDYRRNNKVKPKPLNVPTDRRIMEVYSKGFAPAYNAQKKWLHRYSQWQFLFGLLATYGLRIHEAWHIANWDKPVTLKDGDWVTVDVGIDEEISVQHEGKNEVIPAILDLSNKNHILCIKHDTKTGFRMTLPISPEGHDWIKEFNLLQPLNLPDIENPMKRMGENQSCSKGTSKTAKWFNKKGYGFKAHDLRHAYSIRGHVLGYNPKALADSSGHSLRMSGNNYVQYMKLETKLANLLKASNQQQENRSQLKVFKTENASLKAQLLSKDNEIELLRTKLKMYEAIAENKNRK